jgi:hypothetical protein
MIKLIHSYPQLILQLFILEHKHTVFCHNLKIFWSYTVRLANNVVQNRVKKDVPKRLKICNVFSFYLVWRYPKLYDRKLFEDWQRFHEFLLLFYRSFGFHDGGLLFVHELIEGFLELRVWLNFRDLFQKLGNLTSGNYLLCARVKVTRR